MPFPNPDTRFRPGNPGGPGRPPGASITTHLKRIGAALAKAGGGDALARLLGDVAEAEGLTFNELAALRLWAIALHEADPGHALRALGVVLDRQEGRARQAVEVSGPAGGPVAVQVYLPENGRGDAPAPPARSDDPPAE